MENKINLINISPFTNEFSIHKNAKNVYYLQYPVWLLGLILSGLQNDCFVHGAEEGFCLSDHQK